MQRLLDDWFKKSPSEDCDAERTPVRKKAKTYCEDGLEIVTLDTFIKDMRASNVKLVNFVANIKDGL